MLFLGNYDYAMDERGRVPIPPRFRDAFVTGIVLTQGTPDRCIRAYPQSSFDDQAAEYLAQPVTSRVGRIMRREFFSRAWPSELDRQGRVLVPGQLRSYAGLEGGVTLLGSGEWIEIWNPDDLRKALAEEEDEYIRKLESE